MALTLIQPPKQATSSGRLSLINNRGQTAQPTSQPTPTSGYTNIGGKSYPTASLVKTQPQQTNLLQQANNFIGNLTKPGEGLGAVAGRLMQKVPSPNLGTKGKDVFKATETETKIVDFLSNMPSAIVNSWGKSLETLSSTQGRKQLKEDAKKLPQTVQEVKDHLSKKEWGLAFQTALDNSAISVGMDVADFIPVTWLGKAGLKGVSAGFRKTAQQIVKEGVEEAGFKTVKEVFEPVKVPETPKVDDITKGLEGGGGKVEPKVEPIGEGVTKVSKLGLRVEQTAIEKKLTDELTDLPEYKQLNMKEQAKKASDLLNTDPDKAMRVALGEELPPEGLLKESVFKALEGSITTPEMAAKLANSPLVSEATALGQKIKALDVKVSDSPVEAIRQVIDARSKALEKRLGRKPDIEKTTKDIKSKVKVPDKYDWGKFLEEIKC